VIEEKTQRRRRKKREEKKKEGGNKETSFVTIIYQGDLLVLRDMREEKKTESGGLFLYHFPFFSLSQKRERNSRHREG